MKRKAFQDLTITDDFMFCKVMQNPKICKELLELILNIKIEKIEYPKAQETIDINGESRGIRMDVYVEDGDKTTVYDIEMQTSNNDSMPKRSRYYQGMIDLSILEKGESFKKLRKTFVIFFCTFDVFGEGLPVYTFENICKEKPDVKLHDESYKIFINLTSNDFTNTSQKVKNMLQYFKTNNPVDKFTQDVETEVHKVLNHREWEVEYMQICAHDMDIRDEGREEGRIEGRIEGEKKGLLLAISKFLAKGYTIQEAVNTFDVSEEFIEEVLQEQK